MLHQDQQYGSFTVAAPRERTGGGKHEERRIKSATRFGVLRARVKWSLACYFRDSSMRELADENPMKTTVTSIAEAVAEKTRDLPNRGFLPVNPDAPLVNLKEALWLVVAAMIVVWLALVADGHYPLLTLLHHPVVRDAIADV